MSLASPVQPWWFPRSGWLLLRWDPAWPGPARAVCGGVTVWRPPDARWSALPAPEAAVVEVQTDQGVIHYELAPRLLPDGRGIEAAQRLVWRVSETGNCVPLGGSGGGEGKASPIRGPDWLQELVARHHGVQVGPALLKWIPPKTGTLSVTIGLSPANPHRVQVLVEDLDQEAREGVWLEVHLSHRGGREELGLRLPVGGGPQRGVLRPLEAGASLRFSASPGWQLRSRFLPAMAGAGGLGFGTTTEVRLMDGVVGEKVFRELEHPTGIGMPPLSPPRAVLRAAMQRAMDLHEELPVELYEMLEPVLQDLDRFGGRVHRSCELAGEPTTTSRADLAGVIGSQVWPVAVVGLPEDAPLEQVAAAWDLAAAGWTKPALVARLVDRSDVARLLQEVGWREVQADDVDGLPALWEGFLQRRPGGGQLPDRAIGERWRRLREDWARLRRSPSPVAIRRWMDASEDAWTQAREALRARLLGLVTRSEALGEGFAFAYTRLRSWIERAAEIRFRDAETTLGELSEALSEVEGTTDGLERRLDAEERERAEAIMDLLSPLARDLGRLEPPTIEVLLALLGERRWEQILQEVSAQLQEARARAAAAPEWVRSRLTPEVMEPLHTINAPQYLSRNRCLTEALDRLQMRWEAAREGFAALELDASEPVPPLDGYGLRRLLDLEADLVRQGAHISRLAEGLRVLLPPEKGVTSARLVHGLESAPPEVRAALRQRVEEAIWAWDDWRLPISPGPEIVQRWTPSATHQVEWLAEAGRALEQAEARLHASEPEIASLLEGAAEPLPPQGAVRVRMLGEAHALAEALRRLHRLLGPFEPPAYELAWLAKLTPLAPALQRACTALAAFRGPTLPPRSLLDEVAADLEALAARGHRVDRDLHLDLAGRFQERWYQLTGRLRGSRQEDWRRLAPVGAWRVLCALWRAYEVLPPFPRDPPPPPGQVEPGSWDREELRRELVDQLLWPVPTP